MKTYKSLGQIRSDFNVNYWTGGFFGVDEHGDTYVNPKLDPNHQYTFKKLIVELDNKGVGLPVLVRMPQIIHQRIHSVCGAFNNAIDEYGYKNEYLLVYPVKVNQQKDVVDEILASQQALEQSQLGLEAGSKSELLAVLSIANKASSTIICNGYKDTEYVRLALLGEKLGHKVFIVIEKLSELSIVLDEAEKLSVVPRLGLRIRLASQGAGKWQASGGEKSKFGLSASQVIDVVDTLITEGKLSTLQLVHFHLGSQMANIRDVRKGVSEAARFYCELQKLGTKISYLDVGGGLAIDYDGTRSQSPSSMNYGLAEYAKNIVSSIGDICAEYDYPHPTIISESGRYITAHHAVLLTNVIGEESYVPETVKAPGKKAPNLLSNIWNNWLHLIEGRNHTSLIEVYNNTRSDLAEAHTLFEAGTLSLHERAWAEKLSLKIYNELRSQMSGGSRIYQPVLDELEDRLADKLYLNFSLFQSMPDAWGINQVFPILPISGLKNVSDRRAVLLDITCDSDGVINEYVDSQGIERTISIPDWEDDEDKTIGFFLVGAYQEILGAMHNLFGDTNSVTVRFDDDNNLNITSVDFGDTVEDMLKYVHIDVNDIRRNFKIMASQEANYQNQVEILEELNSGLTGYTYLEDY
ncbi:biosynthetic arginine decarboxylase [Vibrio sp. HN007]|uniref:biosynthetic arginine decarboxylase n=1 Tax=Vibrio iocasae TaxID=3098914 RepID=UPI0035D50265